MLLLELKSVVAGYGPSSVLNSVRIEVAVGQLVCVLGRNGAGKSTMLKCIAGWVKASAGSITFQNHELSAMAPEAIARLGIGFVPEDRRIFPTLTVAENLNMGLLPAGPLPVGEKAARMDEAFSWFPRLKERRSQMGKTLSGGEQQMLAMARAWMARPQLLLVDEPSEGLAPMVVDEIFSCIVRLKAERVAVVLVEQNVQRALAIADKAYLMERGIASDCGAPSRVLADPEMRRRLSV
jgi:branched-chain amino acid transport system ATP-binding protein